MPPRKLLQIDDDPAVSAALGVRLRAAGYDVRSAPDGPTGLEAARTFVPDVIVLDVFMPGMDGYEVCRRLRSDIVTARTPIVFLSANIQEETRRAALDAGGDAYLSKPYDAIVLVKLIESCLEERAA